MKKDLTEKQVAQLFEFTRKHYVEYYDVQVELVDHLASSVEYQWEQNPELSFDAALHNVFSGFGIFGFGDIVEEKGKTVWKNQWKLWYIEFKSQFKLPALLKSICIWLVLFMLLTFFDAFASCVTISVFLLILSLYFLISENRTIKKSMDKKLILITHRHTYISFSYIPLYLMQFFGDWITSQNHFLITTLFTILTLLILSYKSTSEKIFLKAKQEYPEAFKKLALN
ncbi:hypothetical protein I5M32_07470 [Pedobacter sp. SD-b]|uniref:Uncharacterized protein n=1 Tax=Pedobacter segetis TaxID=2793069 RepID=A0ABS1BKE2_9SPHI|nr:hypothetical protein [Pedobacter segetis]MBK0382796.1 hypothetical protein [Pedobacter segetis]